MKTSDQIDAIAKAMSDVQGRIVNPGKDSDNSHFGSRYAGLPQGLAVIRKELSLSGATVWQASRIDGRNLILDTRIVHSSGQWVECEWPIGPIDLPPQKLGSATTYARRYSLFSLVGVAGADDDDDGNEASKDGGNREPHPAAMISPVDLAFVKSSLTMFSEERQAAFLSRMRVDSVEKISEADAPGAIRMINAAHAALISKARLKTAAE